MLNFPDRRGGSSGYRKDEYNWRYDSEADSEEVIRASSALENLQLDRKARNLTSSWRLSSFILLFSKKFIHSFTYCCYIHSSIYTNVNTVG